VAHREDNNINAALNNQNYYVRFLNFQVLGLSEGMKDVIICYDILVTR
jgi:hypothetical protein